MHQEPRVPAQRATALRTDIQGMRAVAVAMVLVYHVWPSAMTGGFVGVDVFFVISGFLITTHLMTHPPRRAADFAEFWARRIRRLLPASFLVLAVTLAATRLLGPETLWEQTARQTVGAGLYVVNWLLASDAVDYLAADDAATGVQHYWSLSVEEQFYLFWPLLVAALAALALRLRLDRRLVWGVGFGVVLMVSFSWSVHLTSSDPGRAYFVTTTRVWELAVGGLVALVLLRSRGKAGGRPGLSALVAWAGLAALLVAGFTYDAGTPFPSWTAALPVLGTAAVVGAHAGTQPWSPGRLLALRPVQWLGDISYSVYLWHWPLVVLVAAVSAPFGALDAVGVVLLSLVLAALTTRFVEDPFRARSWNVRRGATYRLAAVGTVGVVALALVQVAEVDRRQEVAAAEVAAALATDDPCLGAGALEEDRDCAPHEGPVVPSPVHAATDKSEAYADVSGGPDCWSSQPDFPERVCTFGEGPVDVVLVGNSHAGHWLPTLQEIGAARGWRITTRLASQCAAADLDMAFETEERTEACRDWVRGAVDATIEQDPDLVVVSNRLSVSAAGRALADSAPAYAEGYEQVLDEFADAEIPVAAIHDTPAPGDGGVVASVPDCLAVEGEDSRACDGTRDEWMTFDPDPVVRAVRAVDDPRIQLVDLNDRICQDERCAAVVGGVVVYFDGSHLTATYARTLAPALDEALVRARLIR